MHQVYQVIDGHPVWIGQSRQRRSARHLGKMKRKTCRTPSDPNYCSKCTPQGFGYCRCEIAANE